ncbi:MAG: xanthine dehydrogenase family protein molybdopterin-binding subunit [Pseudomonadota bacterium]
MYAPEKFDAPARLKGQAPYTSDLSAAGEGYMVVLRAQVAHGVIARLETSAAATMPGMRLILTADDLAREGVAPMALRAPMTDTDGPFYEPRRPVLAEGKVAYAGQPVAVIVADTLAQAQDAAEAVDLDIDALPAVTDVTRAHEAAEIWPDIPQNRAFRWTGGNPERTAALFAGAAHVVETRIAHPRIAISPIETRAARGAWTDGVYSLITPSQGVVGIRAAMSACLGVPTDRIHVQTPNVGGSFAVKIWPYPEQALVLLAARLTGRPVAWQGSRVEAFTADVGGRARADIGRLALDAEGRFLAFEIHAKADMGAFLNTAAPNIVSANSIRPFNQVYNIPGLTYRVEAMLTNAVPTDAYRGAGKPECAHVLERLIDLASERMGIDRVALRRRNLITPADLPHRTAVGETFDGGDFPRILDRLLKAADWDGVEARKAETRASGRIRGAGVGFTLHATGGSTAERSEVRAMPDGTVIVRTSSQDSGQSHRETLAIVASETLELPVDRIRVEQGDSRHLTHGGGTGGSNLMPVAANTVHRTALAMLDRARTRAADLLEAARVDVEYGAGMFRIAGTDRRIALADVAAAGPARTEPASQEPARKEPARKEPACERPAGEEPCGEVPAYEVPADEDPADEEPADEDPADEEPGCVAQVDFEGIHTTFPNGAMACEVVIDPETGKVQLDRFVSVNDLGQIVNEPAAAGQIHGGLAQGIGEALMEGMVFDDDGQPLTGSLMDYGLPRADDVPFFENSWLQTASPNSLIGAKGVGELPSIGTPGLVANAIMDALRPLGVRHLDKPMTPGRIWQAIRGARG